MHKLDRYGTSWARYDGVLYVGEQEVSFDLRQLTNSTIVIGVIGTASFGLHDATKLSGVTTSQASVNTDGWLRRPLSETRSPGTSTHEFLAEAAILSFPAASGSKPSTHEFSLFNYVVPGSDSPNAGYRFQSPVGEMILKPVDHYPDARQALRAHAPFVHTAHLAVTPDRDSEATFEMMREAVSWVCRGLSLASGSVVFWADWISKDRMGRTLRIEHRNNISRPYSSALVALFPPLQQQHEFMEQWVQDDHLLGKDSSWKYAGYFADACSSDLFLETRGVACATLLDALVNEWSQREGLEYLVSDDGARGQALRDLRKWLSQQWRSWMPHDARRMGNEQPATSQIRANAKGVFRRTFGDRLRLFMRALGFDTAEWASVLEGVLRSRNALVHQGRFPEGGGNGDVDEYRRLLMVDWAVLLRVAGYHRDVVGPGPPPGDAR